MFRCQMCQSARSLSADEYTDTSLDREKSCYSMTRRFRFDSDRQHFHSESQHCHWPVRYLHRRDREKSLRKSSSLVLTPFVGFMRYFVDRRLNSFFDDLRFWLLLQLSLATEGIITVIVRFQSETLKGRNARANRAWVIRTRKWSSRAL